VVAPLREVRGAAVEELPQLAVDVLQRYKLHLKPKFETRFSLYSFKG
jgi:hypothetical protein